MVERMYTETDPRMYPAARQSVLSAMIRLVDLGVVASDGDITLDANYQRAPGGQ
jgi:hypothetical protein